MDHLSLPNQINHAHHQDQNFINKPGPFFVQQNIIEEFRYQANMDIWTHKENAKYAAFIMKHTQSMENKGHNKLWTLYKTMSKFVESRNFRQCKLYHQKMLQKYKNIPQIIGELKKDNPFFEKMLKSQSLVLSFGNSQKVNFKNGMDYWKILEELGYQERTKNTSESYRTETTTMKSGKQVKDSLHSQWMVCHQLFIEWTKRLNEIMIQGSKY